jgi:hypothetical protein
MNITILENNDFLKDEEVVNKYKFLYIESKFSEEIMQTLYSRIGVIWTWVNARSFLQNVLNSKFTLEHFKNQFKIYEFIDDISAKQYLKEKSQEDLNNEKILVFNQYQLFWFTSYSKQKKKFGYA